MNRRKFIKNTGQASTGLGLLSLTGSLFLKSCFSHKPFFKISLAEWSLHRTIRSGKLNNMLFPEKAVTDFGIHAVEYVNTFFKDKAENQSYLTELNTRCIDLNVKNVLIMVDGEGELAASNKNDRLAAVENHYKWVQAANQLGCHSIRVNLKGDEKDSNIKAYSTESLIQLSEFAQPHAINIILENHGGLSSHGDWIKDVMTSCHRKNIGTLPDFGNFYQYDRYQGVQDMLPFAKGISAKTNAFLANGEESQIDYQRMLQMVKDSGYEGYIGIEYEGPNANEDEGILKTKTLLEQTALNLH